METRVSSGHGVTADLPGLEELRGDCARMAPHWVAPPRNAPAPVPPSRIHGVTIPSSSVRLIADMSEYGD
ncbi:hypothetical protein [Streptomyces violascens]|uniref:hypothetical protein n=1 Tax=Streptomyces violascens TaxID=67381 RepID=UPI0016784771|nr:hypothetical protein [Streptomyces violascens]